LRSALCCHTNETHAPIANPPNSAQLEGTPCHSPKLQPGLCSSVGMRRRTYRHKDTHLALCCHSNETRAPIANLHNSAQLQGTPSIPSSYIWVALLRWQEFATRSVAVFCLTYHRGVGAGGECRCSMHHACCQLGIHSCFTRDQMTRHLDDYRCMLFCRILRGSFKESAPRKTAENTAKHHGGEARWQPTTAVAVKVRWS